MLLRGSFPVMVTPMNADYSVDFGGLRDNIDFYIDRGARGLIPLGSTGEFSSLTSEERFAVAEAAIDHVAGRTHVIVGASAEATVEAIEYAQQARSAGADAVMILPPYYCKPLADEIYCHFADIARAVDIPIMVYNNPGTTGVDVLAETVLRLAHEFDNVAYIKESTGDVRRIRDILLDGNEDITGFCGAEDLVIESLLVGAKGWVSVVGNVVPDRVTQLFEAVADRGDMEEGWKIYRDILPMCRFLEECGKMAQATKAAMEHIGQAGGPARPPRRPLSPGQLEEMADLLGRLGL